MKKKKNGNGDKKAPKKPPKKPSKKKDTDDGMWSCLGCGAVVVDGSAKCFRCGLKKGEKPGDDYKKPEPKKAVTKPKTEGKKNGKKKEPSIKDFGITISAPNNSGFGVYLAAVKDGEALRQNIAVGVEAKTRDEAITKLGKVVRKRFPDAVQTKEGAFVVEGATLVYTLAPLTKIKN